MKTWRLIQNWLDIKGAVWVAAFSVVALYKFAAGKPLSGEHLGLYGLVLTNFMVSKTFGKKTTTVTTVQNLEDSPPPSGEIQ